MLVGMREVLGTPSPHLHLTGIAEPVYSAFCNKSPPTGEDVSQGRQLRRVGDTTPLTNVY